jgi:hypothetical protein
MNYREAIAQLPDAAGDLHKADEIKIDREQLQKRYNLYLTLQQEFNLNLQIM